MSNQRYFTITRENASPNKTTGKWKVKLPWEFITSENYPKNNRNNEFCIF
ncbi:hypothetical protein ENUP19_0131G0002 [Entamoeba nuttalli]|uniref:Uncharacterized protein n=1 Tax=Entamoeba nuttalli TaxID=412467 RepID=A0ABQ0DJY1_9EUKA